MVVTEPVEPSPVEPSPVDPSPVAPSRSTVRAPRPASPKALVVRAATGAGPAVAAFVVARAAGVMVLTLWAHRTHRHPRDLLGLGWDGLWYHRIADWGYGTFIPGWEAPGLRYDDLAFFPLYPMAVRAADTVLPVGSVASALLVAWAGAIAAAWGVFAVAERCYGRRTATALVVVWALLPHSVVLSMAYTEPLMTAFAAWALYAAVTRRWLTAGLLAVLAGLTRPNAVAVAAAVSLAALAHCRRHPRDVRAWTAAAVAPLGWCGYVGWVGLREGHVRGYFEVQTRWGSDFDFGHYALHYVKHMVLGPETLTAYVSTAMCAAAALLLVLALLDRMPLPLFVYSAVLVVITLGGAGFFSCKPRFLLPAFPLLVPCARALAKARPRTAAVAVVTLAGISLGYGAYLLTVVTVPL
ncbi:Dolichyl-phosphate-mannose-protein mannosyltransferase [Actinacidiphila alni]|uniref:Dolichyl-phosphate-mannose-protein mannosyltransferase n=1 Tax=Actinacidiphila alni TaxID=380248 RepID=A0A1I2KV07_9ACTN|nr:hypothetical protein [Actinacidiphila alni]SFF70922.1 Dolichyl-phosphate-mannose-protein mannosyltransferase [Actinacidiphila alni]